jgi:hypothetical protein
MSSKDATSSKRRRNVDIDVSHGAPDHELNAGPRARTTTSYRNPTGRLGGYAAYHDAPVSTNPPSSQTEVPFDDMMEGIEPTGFGSEDLPRTASVSEPSKVLALLVQVISDADHMSTRALWMTGYLFALNIWTNLFGMTDVAATKHVFAAENTRESTAVRIVLLSHFFVGGVSWTSINVCPCIAFW